MDEPPKVRTCSQGEQVPQATQSRKRRIDGDNDAEPRTARARLTRLTSEPARLTRRNLARFNKMTKKNGTKKASASASSESAAKSSTTKTVSTTSSGFAIQAYENGILPPPRAKPPTNLEDLRERLAEPRGTASPPESVYEDYVNRVGVAPNEATMVFEVGGELLKKHDDKVYNRAFNQAFTGFPREVGFNNGLSAPQPDFVEGLQMPEYGPFPVRKHVTGAVLYEDNPCSLTLPHVAGEWKGPGKDMEEARLQSSYDGAALVYARSQALNAMGKPYLQGHAKITTFTTDGTNLNLFANYAAQTEDGTLEYHQYPITSANLTRSYQDFKEGRRYLRNAQDLAKEESYRLRDELKDYWKARGSQPVSLPTMEDDCEVVEHQPVYQPAPPTPSKPKSSKTHSHSSHSTATRSKAPPSTHGYAPSSGQKRKASVSQGSSSSSSKHSSKYRDYWKKDTKSGRFYHKHSDGTISWLEEDEEDDD